MSNIQKISIDQQIAEIGVRNVPAQMHITLPRMKMKITSESPQMEIDKKDPAFKVNWRKVRSESGLKPPPEFSYDYRNKGIEGAVKGTKTAADDGNFLGELRIPGDRVAKLAHNKTMSEIIKKRQVNIDLMPKSSPEVEWDKGYMRINWSKHSIVIDWDGEYMPQLTVDPRSSIEIFLRTEPYFRVTVEDWDDPNMTGRYVDRAI